MKREEMLDNLKGDDVWDIVIIGGGATGLGTAVDAAARNYKTLLIEQEDFAKATSSRSTKLIHGGLRYLQQGNIHLVIEALKERGRLKKNAPHLVSSLAFIVPNYQWWEAPFYGIGLKMYDMLAGKLGLEKSHHMSKKETIDHIPTVETKGLRGGVVYYDGQFDDARLAITLAQTAVDLGSTAINYMKCTSLVKEKGVVHGIQLKDSLSGKEHEVRAKVVINATGIFSDEIRKQDNPKASEMMAPSQGVHLILDQSFLPGDSAILLPHTSDKRVLFFVPWHNRVIVGTTDTAVKKPLLEAKAWKEEIDFLLEQASQYLSKHPKKEDVLSIFAGLRPLVRTGKSKRKTAELARDHVIEVSDSKLISIMGGKWTTYRKMAEDVIDQAIKVGSLKKVKCKTENLPLHGYMEGVKDVDSWDMYGSDAKRISDYSKENRKWGELLHYRLPYFASEVIWAVREEMAQKLEDVLARRTRALLLDARASIKIAPEVAQLMAKELGEGEDWIKQQIQDYQEIASNYVL